MTSPEELRCRIALTFCQGVGPVTARRLMECAGSAADVFRRRHELPRLMNGLNATLSAALGDPNVFRMADRELNFAERHQIACLTQQDEGYPSRLLECDDAPTVLYFRGKANLNRLHIVSIVGTRQPTDYGRQFCADFLNGLTNYCPDTLVVSGLAYGIDIHAHTAALANGLATVGVLAHGLDRIYPPEHRKVAVEMTEQGGLLTEFPQGTQPDRFNFISRNRIVAGMADAVIVVESREKGGSLITARMADEYHRDCFALPGRTTDPKSKGCNNLIHAHKAYLLQNAESFVQDMGWNTKPLHKKAVQRDLFPELTGDEDRVARILRKEGELHINQLAVAADMPVHRLSALLFEMEMKGLVKPLVGSVYRLI